MVICAANQRLNKDPSMFSDVSISEQTPQEVQGHTGDFITTSEWPEGESILNQSACGTCCLYAASAPCWIQQ